MTTTKLRTVRYLTDFMDTNLNVRKITNSVDDLTFLDDIDQLKRIDSARDSIRSYSESIYTVESNLITEKEQKTAMFLNALMAVLTIVSLLSVVAALIQVFQALNIVEGSFTRELREKPHNELDAMISAERSQGIEFPKPPEPQYAHAPVTLDPKDVYIGFILLTVIVIATAVVVYIIWRKTSRVR